MKRIFIAATSKDLSEHRKVAAEEVRRHGFEADIHEDTGSDGQPTVLASCFKRIDDCDAVLAIVARMKGGVPDSDQGGDGERSYTAFEIDYALKEAVDKKEVLLLRAEDPDWPDRLCEHESADREWVENFRARLPPGEPFRYEKPPLEGFRQRVGKVLLGYRKRLLGELPEPARQPIEDLKLRTWKEPEQPNKKGEPYPLLLPYSDPELFAGREREVKELRRLVSTEKPILGLYAMSGAGKSSLLQAGLLPELRQSTLPVVMTREPMRVDLAKLLIKGLAEGEIECPDGDHQRFVELLRAIREQAGGHPPVLILDQVEDLLRPGDDARAARVRLGALLVATACEAPGIEGPLCRWVLAYREEDHGPLCRWLKKALVDVRDEDLRGLPEPTPDLADGRYFDYFILEPLGSEVPVEEDPDAWQKKVFLDAIRVPLELRDTEGRPRFPWFFPEADRLAEAFAEVRKDQRGAALVPQLQVVLRYLLKTARAAPQEGGPQEMHLDGKDPRRMIEHALDDHFERVLHDVTLRLDTADPRAVRTRTLLALKELSDGKERCGKSRPVSELETMIGKHGRAVLEHLEQSDARILIIDRRSHGDDLVRLSHDSIACVVVKTVGDEQLGALSLDTSLIAATRIVASRSEEFAQEEVHDGSTQPSDEIARTIAKHESALIRTETHKAWWRECRRRRRTAERRRWAIITSVAALAVIAAIVWYAASSARKAKEEERVLGELTTMIAGTDAESVVSGLGRLALEFPDRIDKAVSILEQKEDHHKSFENLPEKMDPKVVLGAVRLTMPLATKRCDSDHRLTAVLLWTLDRSRPKNGDLAQEYASLRKELVEQLRNHHPIPSELEKLSAEKNPWVIIEGDSFEMGSPPKETGRNSDETQHWVTVSTFEMQRHEVTLGEYRKFNRDFKPRLWRGFFSDVEWPDDHPVAGVTWYEAYAYAAWLGEGARLPTESEWEYAARRKTKTRFWSGDAEEDLARVGWYESNSEGVPHEVCTAKENRAGPDDPWELCDMHGNVWEWVSDWHEEYPDAPTRDEAPMDPHGPTRGLWRFFRGGSCDSSADSARSANRNDRDPWFDPEYIGFRVVRPASPS